MYAGQQFSTRRWKLVLCSHSMSRGTYMSIVNVYQAESAICIFIMFEICLCSSKGDMHYCCFVAAVVWNIEDCLYSSSASQCCNIGLQFQSSFIFKYWENLSYFMFMYKVNILHSTFDFSICNISLFALIICTYTESVYHVVYYYIIILDSIRFSVDLLHCQLAVTFAIRSPQIM